MNTQARNVGQVTLGEQLMDELKTQKNQHFKYFTNSTWTLNILKNTCQPQIHLHLINDKSHHHSTSIHCFQLKF